jgi:hypothetical protein
MTTMPKQEMMPEKGPEQNSQVREVVAQTGGELNGLSEKMTPENIEPLHVTPGDIVSAAKKHEEMNGKSVPPETIAQVTQRILYQELA